MKNAAIFFCHASWCAPCKRAGRDLIEPLEAQGVPVIRLDADALPSHVEALGVRRLPALVMAADEERTIWQGVMPDVEEVSDWYDRHCLLGYSFERKGARQKHRGIQSGV